MKSPSSSSASHADNGLRMVVTQVQQPVALRFMLGKYFTKEHMTQQNYDLTMNMLWVCGKGLVLKRSTAPQTADQV